MSTASNLFLISVIVAFISVLLALLIMSPMVGVLALMAILVLNIFIDVSYFLRCIWIVVKMRLFRQKYDLLESSSTSFYVLPSYIDFLGHMNNARYLRECDFSRFHHWIGVGAVPACYKYITGLALVAKTIRYRRSLELFQCVDKKTRIIFWDEKAFYVETQFVNDDGFICAIAIDKQIVVQKKNSSELTHVTPQLLISKILGKEVEAPQPSKELQLWIEHNIASSESLKASK